MNNTSTHGSNNVRVPVRFLCASCEKEVYESNPQRCIICENQICQFCKFYGKHPRVHSPVVFCKSHLRDFSEEDYAHLHHLMEKRVKLNMLMYIAIFSWIIAIGVLLLLIYFILNYTNTRQIEEIVFPYTNDDILRKSYSHR